ncbi:FAD-binding domain-containing protein [Biscogniauxia mediterranea]|nr:FAD-binding domain-containing protein [Biscogniauxia mediterranea]
MLPPTCAGVGGGGELESLPNTCQALRNAGVRNVYSPVDTFYSERVESYWSLTSRLAPKCFVLPRDTEEVSVVVRTLARDTRCRFAVRSGGHSSTAGASSIVDGITIDLSLLNSTTYDSATGIASIGAGSRWLDVYRTLDALGVGVPGGRIGTVGVGGLLTGGGCSLYLFRQGLACDSVHSFEVVLADGRIVTASSAENADLFEALKGGGGNFGIVTRFNMIAFRTSPIWSASLVHPESVGQVHLPALRKWTDNVKNYQDSSVFVFWSYRPALKQTVVITSLADVSGTASPPIFTDFLAILGAVSSTATTTNMSTIALNTQTEGYRNIWFTLTFKNDEETLARAVDLHGRLVEEMKTESSDGDFETQCFFQPLPAIVGRHGQERGGNILGISEKEGNAVILLGSLGVNGLGQEALGRKKMLAWKDELEQYTKGVGTYIPYRYMNYADGSQDVISSYGEQSVLKMQAVSRKYDPDGIFQTRVPGGFKIPDIAGMAVTNGE